MINKRNNCSTCKSANTRILVYGLMEEAPEAEWKEFQQEYQLAGCVIHENSPGYICLDCQTKFGERQDT